MGSKQDAGAAPGRWTTVMLALLAGGGLIAAMVVILTAGDTRPPAAPAASPAPGQNFGMKDDATAVPAPGTAAPPADAKAPGAHPLAGRWLRPDGGYVLDIRTVGADGKVEAAYFNPGPIRVSRAEVRGEGDTRSLFVELRDVNYPGCTYNLRHDAAKDQLVGVYYQAALQQQFDVVFERMK
jgi:hypothetical protein